MPDLIGLPVRKLAPNEDYCCQAHHTARVKAEIEFTKPDVIPPLPGPRKVFMCMHCAAEFVYNVVSDQFYKE